MFSKFFKNLKKHGFKTTIIKTKIKIKYVANRILGRVDKYNNLKKLNAQKIINTKSYEYYKNVPVKDYPKEIQSWFNRCTRANMNIENPSDSFQQKIQWLKCFDSTLLKSHLTDKWLAKEYIKALLGEKYTIKTLGVYNKFEDIDFDVLPNKFVIKSTHGSGQIEIIRDKTLINKVELKQIVDSWLNFNFAFKAGFEAHYANIIPRIIIEEYIEAFNDNLYDYKFMCLNGKVALMWVDSDRFSGHKRNFFDTDWKPIVQENYFPINSGRIKKPTCFKKLIALSEQLASNFALVICDFYVIGNEIKFGELTFTPGSGIADWKVNSYFDKFLGEKLQLPKPTQFKKLTKKQILKAEKEFLNSLKRKEK